MGKQRYERIKKTLSVLLLVSFIIFVTDASASAKQINVPRNYQTGYHEGAQDGYKVGYNNGYEDCLKYGKEGVLKKVPAPAIKYNRSKNYNRGYKVGFKNGYLAGYNKGRFKCLKKEKMFELHSEAGEDSYLKRQANSPDFNQKL